MTFHTDGLSARAILGCSTDRRAHFKRSLAGIPQFRQRRLVAAPAAAPGDSNGDPIAREQLPARIFRIP